MYPAQTITIEWTAEKCLDRWQTTNKLLTQAGQPNKRMVESAGRRSLPKYQKAAWAATVATPKTTSIKRRLNIQSTNLAGSWIHSVCLSIYSQNSQKEYVRGLQNSTKEILRIGRRKVHVLPNKQNWFAYFTLLFCEQRNKQEIITHAYTAIALVEVCLIYSLKPNKRQNNEQPNEQKNKRNARPHKKAAESAEYISGMKRNQNIKWRSRHFSQVIRESRFGCPRIARVTSSKNWVLCLKITWDGLP